MPVNSTIGGFINAASGKSGVVRVWLIGMTRNGDRSSATEWADITVL
jgi:hypothetical protein